MKQTRAQLREELRQNILSVEPDYDACRKWMERAAKEDGKDTYIENGVLYTKNFGELTKAGYFDQYLDVMCNRAERAKTEQHVKASIVRVAIQQWPERGPEMWSYSVNIGSCGHRIGWSDSYEGAARLAKSGVKSALKCLKSIETDAS